MDKPLEITPAEANRQLAQTRPACLIDVREPEEWNVAHIAGSELVPMASVPARLQRIEAWSDDSDLLVLCHHGVRSLQVVNWLRAQGIENCYSVNGGIDRWSVEIDPSVPRY